MPRRELRKRWRVLVGAGFLLVATASFARATDASVPSQSDTGNEFVLVELSTVGFDRTAGVPVVLLRDPESGRVVPIWIGPNEAQAIAMALHGISAPRPMTHDLMASLLSEVHAVVEEVLVHDLRDNTYLGKVRLRTAADEIREIDCRPSDGLALALRTGAAIRVARGILAQAPGFDFIAPEGSGQVVQAMGITVLSQTPALREAFKLPERSGVVVRDVSGQARDQGLSRGDLIVDVNGRDVHEPMDFFEAIRSTAPGDPVRIKYWRENEERQLELRADPAPGRRNRERPLVA